MTITHNKIVMQMSANMTEKISKPINTEHTTYFQSCVWLWRIYMCAHTHTHTDMHVHKHTPTQKQTHTDAHR